MTNITLIGQPNVGKSSLFNKLIGERKAIVSPISGVTRDRQCERIDFDGTHFIDLVDTSGWCDHPEEDIENHMNDQLNMAIELTDHCLFMVNGKAGINHIDMMLARRLQKSNIPFWLVVNQCDEGNEYPELLKEFLRIGQKNIYYISCADRYGIQPLKNALAKAFAKPYSDTPSDRLPITFIGRPNAGKSSLINAILKEDRLIVSEYSGTTRDHVKIPFTYRDKHFELIDTAGMRRKQKSPDDLEKYSSFRTIKALMDAHVVCLLIDQTVGITDQDLKLYDLCQQYQKSLIIIHSKSDIKDQKSDDYYHHAKERSFLDAYPNISISSVYRDGIPELFRHIIRIGNAMSRTFSTSQLTQILEEAVDLHQPPMINSRRIKLRVAHPRGTPPPHHIIIRGKQTNALPGHYKRYLNKFFTDRLGMKGCYLQIDYEQDLNPYSDK